MAAEETGAPRALLRAASQDIDECLTGLTVISAWATWVSQQDQVDTLYGLHGQSEKTVSRDLRSRLSPS